MLGQSLEGEMRKLQTKTKTESMVSLEQELPLREKVRDAKARWESSYLTFAKYIYEVHAAHSWEDWGYSSLNEYCEKELDFHYRRAMFMIDIYGSAVMYDIPFERLDKIGWTKAREIVRVLNSGNVEKWLDVAENSTFKELIDKVRAAKAADADNPVPLDTDETQTTEVLSKPTGSALIFKTESFEYEIISGALDEAKASLKTTNPTFALSVICMEWKKQHDEEGATDVWTLKEWMKYLSDRFGVKLVKVVQEHKEEKVEEPDELLDDEEEEDLGDLDELD